MNSLPTRLAQLGIHRELDFLLYSFSVLFSFQLFPPSTTTNSGDARKSRNTQQTVSKALLPLSSLRRNSFHLFIFHVRLIKDDRLLPFDAFYHINKDKKNRDSNDPQVKPIAK